MDDGVIQRQTLVAFVFISCVWYEEIQFLSPLIVANETAG